MKLSESYDALLTRADALLKKYNPCAWDNVAKDCARGTGGCCNGCAQLAETGCTIQSLACRLWICPEIRLEMPEHIIDEFREVWDDAQKLNLLTFRGGKEDSLKNARYNGRTHCPKHVCVNKYGDTVWILERS